MSSFTGAWLDRAGRPTMVWVRCVVPIAGTIGFAAARDPRVSCLVALIALLVAVVCWSMVRPSLGFALVPLACLAFPPVRSALPPRGLFPEEIFIVCLLVSLLFARKPGPSSLIKVDTFNVLFWGLLASQTITLFLGTFHGGVVPRDLFELIRTVKYYTVFNVARDSTADDHRWFARGLFVGFLAASVIAILEYADLAGLSAPLIKLYGVQSTFRFLDVIQRGSGTWRVPGTSNNPNQFGFLVLVSTLGLLFNKHPGLTRKADTLAKIGLLLLGSLVIFLTQSRTALIAGAASFLIWVGVQVCFGNWRRTVVTVLPALIVVLLVAQSVKRGPPDLRIFRFNEGRRSFTYRVGVWSRALDATFETSPLFGLGPEKYTEVQRFEELDSESVTFIKRWGLVGFAGYLYLVLAIAGSGLRLLDHGCKASANAMQRGTALMLLAGVVAIISITACGWQDNRFSDLFFALVGVQLAGHALR